MPIFVKRITGDTSTLGIDYFSNNIKDVKRKIEEKEGIPVKQQKLGFKGRELKDEFPLQNYDIWREMALCLALDGEEMNIVVQLDNGKTLALKMESTNTVSDVKYLINEEEEMSVVGRQKLYMEGSTSRG